MLVSDKAVASTLGYCNLYAFDAARAGTWCRRVGPARPNVQYCMDNTIPGTRRSTEYFLEPRE